MTLFNAATPWVYLRELLMLGYIRSLAFKSDGRKCMLVDFKMTLIWRCTRFMFDILDEYLTMRVENNWF